MGERLSRRMMEESLEALPVSVMLVDQHEQIQFANHACTRELGLCPAPAESCTSITALGCRESCHAGAHPHDERACLACVARELVGAVARDGHEHHRHVHVHDGTRGNGNEVELLVRAAPYASPLEPLTLLIVDQISELTAPAIDAKEATHFHGFVSRNPRMLAVFDTIRRVASTCAAVLIDGESGTGKEVAARAIHAESNRRDHLFVPLNCGAIPDGLLESELFGHVRGAFSGAVSDRKGRFELAAHGTLFLDEIGELDAAMQVKLLRVLQDGHFERVGGETTLRANARIISATNRDLQEAIATGAFRADLFYRLCVVPLRLPPLRERREDLPLLVGQILESVAGELEVPHPVVSSSAMQVIQAHPWPGNVRELENALRFASLHAHRSRIEVDNLPPAVRATQPASAPEPMAHRAVIDTDRVRAAVRLAGGNKSLAARALGIGRATLYRYLADDGGL